MTVISAAADLSKHKTLSELRLLNTLPTHPHQHLGQESQHLLNWAFWL